MKYLTLLVLSFILFTSCQKKRCWNCELAVTLQSGKDTTYKLEVCDKTKKEIQDFEEQLLKGQTNYFLPGDKKSSNCD